jgi:response regulator RpfG family c-di-GMP phosphodiesterase
MEIDTGKTIEELITAIAFITDVEDKRKTYHAWRVAILATALANHYIKPYQLK